MNDTGRPRHSGSITGALILIAIGVLFLLANIRPDFDAWGLLIRYWPLILIVIGLGKILDSLIFRDRVGPGGPDPISGVAIALLVLFAIFGLAVWHGHRHSDDLHDTHSIALLGAKSVMADINMPAGRLTLDGGDSRLLDADFDYWDEEGKPTVDYSVADDRGSLSIRQEGRHIHFGTTHNTWNLHFGGDEPLDLKLNMGAGESNLDFNGLNLTHLDVNIGAGQMNLDLTGPRTTNLEANIQGGVGSAIIRLPKDIGVRVHASGGIGSINTRGLTHEGGDTYVNSAYGKSPSSIDLTVHGGVGEITLLQQ
ncbi:MAG TPA: toast rack family protein [Candidatus Limnocylindrales bacterium]|nr:toast rack family protein [Candidatus Limnocylindrales bacterium]